MHEWSGPISRGLSCDPLHQIFFKVIKLYTHCLEGESVMLMGRQFHSLIVCREKANMKHRVFSVLLMQTLSDLCTLTFQKVEDESQKSVKWGKKV